MAKKQPAKEANKEVSSEKFKPENFYNYPPMVAVYKCESIEECSKDGFFLQRGKDSPQDFGLKKGMVVILTDGKDTENIVVK